MKIPVIELQTTQPTARFVRGVNLSSGHFLRQIQEMQPAGHWQLADGSLECGPVKAPGLVARALVSWLLARRWVSYDELEEGVE